MKWILAALLALQLAPTPVKVTAATIDADIRGFVVHVQIEPHPDNVWICQVVDNGKDWQPRYCGFIDGEAASADFPWPNMPAGKYTVSAFIQRAKDEVITKFDSNTLTITVGKDAH